MSQLSRSTRGATSLPGALRATPDQISFRIESIELDLRQFVPDGPNQIRRFAEISDSRKISDIVRWDAQGAVKIFRQEEGSFSECLVYGPYLLTHEQLCKFGEAGIGLALGSLGISHESLLKLAVLGPESEKGVASFQAFLERE